jgi:hypothetical protein
MEGENRQIGDDTTVEATLLETWLNSPEADLAKAAISGILGDTIQSFLPKLAKNFSAAECAEMVAVAVNHIIKEPSFNEGIMKYIEDLQAKKVDSTELDTNSLGIWSDLARTEGDKS